MKHNRRTKVIVIVALLVAVLGLSVGFAAYSKSLTIQNAQATVKGNSGNFNVVFSTVSGSTGTGQVTATASSGVGSGSATLAATAITNLVATFNKAGDIVYDFYVYNAGTLTAYLKNVTIDKPACTSSNATQALVTAACADITVKVNVGGQDYTATKAVTDKTGLAKTTGAAVKVTIKNSGTHAVDGDFTAKIANIKLDYSTQPAA